MLLFRYTYHTYNNLNKHPKGTVIVLVIPITLTIISIDNEKVLLLSLAYQTYLQVLIYNQELLLLLSYTDHTCNNLNRKWKGTVIVFDIPTPLTLIWINNQKVMLLLCYTDHTYNTLYKQAKCTVIFLLIPIHLQ